MLLIDIHARGYPENLCDYDDDGADGDDGDDE